MSNPAKAPDLSLKRLCRWVLSYATRRRLPLLAVMLTMLLQVGLALLRPWPMKVLLDYVLGSEPMPERLRHFIERLPGAHTPMSLIGWSVSATVLIFLLGWAVGLANEYAGISLGQRMTYDLAADLFTRLQQLSLRFHTSKSVGDNIRRVTADCACISTILKDALLPVLSSAVTLVLTFGVMWTNNIPLTLLSLAVVPYMVWVFRRYAGPMMELSYVQQETESRIYDVVEQTFSAMPAVQAFCREPLNDRRFLQINRDTLAATMTLTRVELWFKILMGLATAVGTAAILYLGAQLSLRGVLSVGTIVVFLYYLGSLYEPLESMMYTLSTIQAATGSARRVLEVMETEREFYDRPGAAPIASVRGHVEIEAVTFGYDPNHPVLRGLTLDAQPGQSVALVGATGAGKTTLVGLLPRFYDPWQGQVRLDGRDVRDLTLTSLRSQIAIVLQEPFLFPLTIMENIAYGRRHATLGEIEAAARDARAHEFIMQLPDGYHSIVGERGATLSVGQRQRLSIARALLKNAPILILDEPTSALDAETEQLLMEALERLMAQRTTFIIAHRLSTVRRASRIAFLKDGVVAETGTHQELLARRGLYAGFYEAQFNTANPLAPNPSGHAPGPLTDE
jgi:ATP-binding cassette, subfamily B, bacterial